LAEIALGAAPIAGGALLGAVAGNMKGPDVRAVIKADLDLLDRIPEDQVQRRAAMSQMIAGRIDDLIGADQRGRQLRQAAASYQGNWRDIVVFICTVLFTIVWWHVSHHRTNWLPMFVVLIVMSVIAGAYALRGALRAVSQLLRRKPTTAKARHGAP
jgi:ABC-type antimicrobial peptide transport system permease subunit